MLTYEAIHERAMKLWQRDQLDFPIRCRRMQPDQLDHASGAWGRVFERAALSLGWKPGEEIAPRGVHTAPVGESAATQRG